MATDTWHPDADLSGYQVRATPLHRVSFSQPTRFNPFQLVRLLCWPAFAAQSTKADQVKIAHRIRFKGDWSAAFRGSEITLCKQELVPTKNGRRPRWLVATPNYCMGGELGPLPVTYTEWIRDQQKAGESAVAAFLDLFNHRLNVLRHEIKAVQDVNLNHMPPEQSRQADYLASIAGLHYVELQRQIPLPRDTWLGMAGMLTIARNSASSLQRALNRFLGAQTDIEQFIGGWFPIVDSERVHLGRRNHALGKTLLLGKRAWADDAAIRINVRNLDYSRFCKLLPVPVSQQVSTPSSFSGFTALIQLFLDRRCDSHIRLQMRPETCPPSTLTARAKRTDRYIGLCLGQTAWLASTRAPMVREASYLLPAFDEEVSA